MVMFKEPSKHSKLSTKLSTIWQINDYLSKKIDNRLIVDIIDTRGHPDWLEAAPSMLLLEVVCVLRVLGAAVIVLPL